MIDQLNLQGKTKVEVAIDRFKTFEPPEGYFLAFSGGKDSVVIKALADMADSDGARRLEDIWAEDSLLCPACHTYFGEVFDEGYCRKCGQKLIQKRIRVIEK